MASPRHPFLYPRPGRCIYCGDDEAELFEEHIIPFALDGDLAIPEASCALCAQATSRAEGICFGNMFKSARVRFKTATRRRRPKMLPVRYIAANGRKRVVWVPPLDHPTVLFIVAPPQPRFLREFFAAWPEEHALWVCGSGDGLSKHMPSGKERLELASALTQSGDSQHALGVRVCAHGTDGMRDSGLFGQEAA